MDPTTAADREHDLVIFGATGFVGKLTAEYLAGAAPADLRVALAGRSERKLAELRSGLSGAEGWKTIVADSSDPGAMAGLAASTRVVATTVGPYARYGKALVEACARAGTHYADLTGEVLFVRDTIDRCQDLARTSGARIVPSCGYDSIPSDLGVWLLHEQAAADSAGGLGLTSLLATARGGFSGGTIDSMRGQVAEAAKDRGVAARVADPYGLSPDRASEPEAAADRDVTRARRDPLSGRWVAPFVMATYNTRIVRRSNALTGWSYGREFHYQEYMPVPGGPAAPVVAHGLAAGMQAFQAAMAFGPTRAGLDRILPAPGTGPGEESRAKGWFRSTLRTQTVKGARYKAVVAGKGDPGYAGTAVMLGQSALCLAIDDLPDAAGVLTTATAMGGALVDRLRAAGMTLEASADR